MAGGREVRLPFGDGHYAFRLGIGQWARVQDRCNAGPEEIAARLAPTVQAMLSEMSDGETVRRATFMEAVAAGLVGRWRAHDVREPIYQGLLGAGNDPTVVANMMVDMFDGVDAPPIRAHVLTAYAVIMASIEGVPGDPVGKTRSGEIAGSARKTRTRSRTAKSGSV